MQHDAIKPQNVQPETTEDLLVERCGSLAVITLNRPRALNAFNEVMRRKMTDSYPQFARDPMIYAVVVQSSSERAFCAGGDVRELVRVAHEDKEAARRAFFEEYSFNWLHECFSKPTISLIDGAVMGSGVGLSAYGTHRVAGHKYKFAMPETAIGLFPDVGSMWLLSRMPHQIGMYLALTGRSIGRADAFALGLLTHCIPADQYEEIKAAVADTWPVDPLLDERHEDPGPRELDDLAPHIAHCFSAPTVEGVLQRLREVEGPEREWAHDVHNELLTRSPLSLKVTHRHLSNARALDLRQVLEIDYRLACRFLDGHDFHEGVRAALIDKDGSPRWQPERLEDVTPAMVDAYFAPMGEGELRLPTRREMQIARV